MIAKPNSSLHLLSPGPLFRLQVLTKAGAIIGCSVGMLPVQAGRGRGSRLVGSKRKSVHTQSSASESGVNKSSSNGTKRPAVPIFEDPNFPEKKTSPASFQFYQPAGTDGNNK